MKRGFTLVELLVVIIIVVILTGVATAFMNSFFRGQGVRQGGVIVSQAVAQARQTAAETHTPHYLIFSPSTQPDAWMEIHKESAEPGNVNFTNYDGDFDSKTNDNDPAVTGRRIEMPKNIVFETAPQWICFYPSGYMFFNPGFSEVQASVFDKNMNSASPSEAQVDISVRMRDRGFWMCLDLDRASGKVRRSFFLQKEQQ